ncbi:membrane protein [Ruminiclostridium cellobioparum]|nr:membrane protein [Ruminiclostridium cellobioparum]
MFKSRKEEDRTTEENMLTFKDVLALMLSIVQILLPFILIVIAVFTFLIWFLVKFWLKE